MKLTKKHIGQIFDVDGSDGSWWYRLLDVKNKRLLFQDNDGKYWIEDQGRYHDWKPIGDEVHKKNVREGWKKGRQIE